MSNRFFRGARFQRGYGLGCCSVNHYKGNAIGTFSSRQRGHGLGGMWTNFMRWFSPIFSKVKNFALPILKAGGKEIGKEAVSAASDIANAVLEGKDAKESATQRIESGVDSLIDRASRKMEGHGINRRKRKIFGSLEKKKAKKRTRDIFDIQ